MEPGPLLHSALTRLSCAECRFHGASNQDTHLDLPHSNSSVYLTTTYMQCTGRITIGMRCGQTNPQDSAFSSLTPAPPGMTLTRTAWFRLNPLCTGVGCFQSYLRKWGMVSSVAHECGAEEQVIDHVVLQCPIHQPPHGLHSLITLDDETIKWLLNTCLGI